MLLKPVLPAILHTDRQQQAFQKDNNNKKVQNSTK